MKTFPKNAAFRAAAVCSLSLLVAAAVAPGALASGDVNGNVKVSNTETVQVLMDASAKVNSQRVYEQLVLTGNGTVDIANPVSTDGLRNLDGFGSYDVRDGKVRIKTDVSGVKKYRSVSTFTKKLPLDISVKYVLDGKEVKPGDVVGKSGKLEVRYRVTNNTGVVQDVPFKDGNGNDKTAPELVVIPMVGSLTTVLPSTFTKVQSAEANAAGDGRGGTQLSFTMTLFPPIGKNYADFGYTAQIKDGVIPPASMSALPLNPLESPSFSGGAASYKSGAETGADLTAGATEIDANLLKLRDGGNDLLAGLLKLQAGAGQLSAGLNNDAAPGAKKLADGASQLNAGAKKLAGGTNDLSDGAGKLKAGADKLTVGAGQLAGGLKDANKGAGDLAAGLKTASAGAPALADGVAKLLAGAQALDAGLVTLNGKVVPVANQINDATANLILGVNGPLSAALLSIRNYADVATTLVSGATFDTGQHKTDALNAIGGAKLTAQGVEDTLKDVTPETGFMYVLGAIKQGAAGIAAGVVHTTTDAVIDPGDGPTLKYGTSALVAGLAQLQAQAGPLIAGLGQLSAGADKLAGGTGQLKAGADQLAPGAAQLAAGTGDLKAGANKLNAGAGALKDGTGQLSAGAGTLADGLGTAAAGSSQLAAGLDQAAEGAPAIPEGAERLSKEGTSKLIEAGDATASDYGLKYAVIEAGAARASSAQPYGSPEGATALTAYKFELAGADGAGSANVKRGLAAILLLAGAAAATVIRRRVTN